MSYQNKPENLTVYLAKSSHVDPRSVVENPGSLKQVSFELTLGANAILYVPNAAPKTPRWSRFFDGHVPVDTFGLTRSEGALLTLSHRGRIFALTFGTGRFQLKQDCWEERFGLRTALNCIGTNIVQKYRQTYARFHRPPHARTSQSRGDCE